MTTITIELCAEDRARLDNILEALQQRPLEGAGKAPSATTKAATASTQKAAAEKPAQEAPTPAADAPGLPSAPEPVEAPKPEPAKAEPVREVTTAELQNKVVQLVRAGKKDESRSIVTEYADSVSAIPEDKRAEVLERLNALEG